MSSSTFWRVCFCKGTQKFAILPNKESYIYPPDQLASIVIYYIDGDLLPQGIIHLTNKNKDFETGKCVTWISRVRFEFDINNINPQNITTLRCFEFMYDIAATLIRNKKDNVKQIESLSNQLLITKKQFENYNELNKGGSNNSNNVSNGSESSNNSNCNYNYNNRDMNDNITQVAKNDGQVNKLRHKKSRKSGLLARSRKSGARGRGGPGYGGYGGYSHGSGLTRLDGRDRPVARRSGGGGGRGYGPGFGGFGGYGGYGVDSHGSGCDHRPVARMSKTYQCKDCSMKFNSLLESDKHKLTHISNRPFKCQFQGCKRSFNNMANCKNHYQSHESGNNSNNSD